MPGEPADWNVFGSIKSINNRSLAHSKNSLRNLTSIALVRGHLREVKRPDIEQIQYLVQIKAELSKKKIRRYHSSDRKLSNSDEKRQEQPRHKKSQLNRLKRLLFRVQIVRIVDRIYTCNGSKRQLKQIWSLYFSWESWKRSQKQQKSLQMD